MALAQIKALFKTGAIPTQSDFESLIDKIPNNEGGRDIDLSNPATPYLNGIRTIIDTIDSCTYIAILATTDETLRTFTIPVAFRSYSTEIGDIDFLFQASYDNEVEPFTLDIVNDSNILKERLENRNWVTISLKENRILEPYIVSINNNEEHYVINRVYQNQLIRCTTIQHLNSTSPALYIVKTWDLLTQADWNKIKKAIETNTIRSDTLTDFLTNRCKQV